MMAWEWKEQSVLYNLTPQVKAEDIFQAVCDELERYYCAKDKGVYYNKEKHSIVYEDNCITGEAVIRLSYSNMAEKSIWIEIVSTFYDTYLTKECTERNVLFTYDDINFEYDLQHPSEKHTVHQLFGGRVEVENIAGRKDFETVWYGRSCGIYNITPEKFLKIAQYIDKKILPWVKKIQTPAGVTELIERKRVRQKNWLLDGKRAGVPSCLRQYIERQFPEVLTAQDTN